MQRHGIYNMYLGQANFSEGSLKMRTGQSDKAYASLTRGVDAIRHFEGEQHHDVLTFQSWRISALLKMQRTDEARILWVEADAQRTRQRDWPQDDDLGAT